MSFTHLLHGLRPARTAPAGRVRRGRLAAAAAAALVGLCAPATATAGSPEAEPWDFTVVLYGDSIGEEIAPYLEDNLAMRLGWSGHGSDTLHLVRRVFGGTNACDFAAQARADAETLDPDAVVVLFTGNAFTSCMRPGGVPLTGDELVDVTVRGVDEISSMFDVPVIRVGFARGRGMQRVADLGATWVRTDRINDRLAEATLAGPASWVFVDVEPVLLERGRWSATLPCRTFDRVCVGGRTPVRSAVDGTHLCPGAAAAVAGVLNVCGVYSGGAERIARAVASGLGRVLPLLGTARSRH